MRLRGDAQRIAPISHASLFSTSTKFLTIIRHQQKISRMIMPKELPVLAWKEKKTRTCTRLSVYMQHLWERTLFLFEEKLSKHFCVRSGSGDSTFLGRIFKDCFKAGSLGLLQHDFEDRFRGRGSFREKAFQFRKGGFNIFGKSSVFLEDVPLKHA